MGVVVQRPLLACLFDFRYPHKSFINMLYVYTVYCVYLCDMVSDAIDGKHARRIGACSPIGELLDHGVDSFRLMAPMLTCVVSLFGRGEYGWSAKQLLCILLALESAAVLTLWQQYLSKTMIYNWAYDIVQYVRIFHFNVLSSFIHTCLLMSHSGWWDYSLSPTTEEVPNGGRFNRICLKQMLKFLKLFFTVSKL